MENENIKRNNDFEESEIKEETLKTEETELLEETTEEEVFNEENADSDEWIPDSPECAEEKTTLEEGVGEETETDEVYDEDDEDEEWRPDGFVEPEPVEVELSEEEIAEIEAFKKQRRKKCLIISAVVAAVLAIAAFFICYTEGFGSKTIVDVPMASVQANEKMGFWDKLKADDVKYENPIVSVFEKLIGKNKNAILKINGEAIDKDVFNSYVNTTALNYFYSLLQTGLVSDISSFDWDEFDEASGLSHKEFSKGMAIETGLVPICVTIMEGEKNGVVFDDADKKKVTDWIAEQKASLGGNFEEIIKNNGYADEDTLYKVQCINVYMQKVYEDIESNPDKYITEDMRAGLGDDKVTVKHILIQGSTDEEKAEAKKKAEEVLAKAKNGEDFDKLIAEYNEDPGATDEGYTFANDGTMVQEFADASFALSIDEISDLVETDYGYHIIKRLERAVSADDYIEALSKNAVVRIKKGVYDKMGVTIDLNFYFGAPQQTENSEPVEETTQENEE